MLATKELIRWLKTLAPESSVWIDEGGLTLRTDSDPEAYYEVGGEPDEPEED